MNVATGRNLHLSKRRGSQGHHHENAQDNRVGGVRFLGLQDSGKPYNQNMRIGKIVNRRLVLDER